MQALGPVRERLGVRLECAGGKEECRKLAEGVFEEGLPYVVLRDGDYRALYFKRNPHRRVLFLEMYSIESYICEVSAICEVIVDLGRVGGMDKELGKRVERAMDGVLADIKALICRDAAEVMHGGGVGILPEDIEQIAQVRGDIKVHRESVEAILAEPTAVGALSLIHI